MKQHLTNRQIPRAGFNLVEAAIVLGIVGLVIGGIWVAASSVRLNMQVNRTYTAIQTIVEGANRLYANMPLPSSVTSLNGLLIDAGVVPADLVNGTSIKTPWNTNLSIQLRVLPMKLQVYLQNLPNNICIQLVNKLLANSDFNVGVGTNGIDIIYLPMSNIQVGQSQSQIASRCSGSLTGNSWIEFQFPAPK